MLVSTCVFLLALALGSNAQAYLPVGKDHFLTDSLLREVVDRMGRDLAESYLDTPLISRADKDSEDTSFYVQENPNPSIRDQEYLQHSSLWGHQYMTGGAGEGKQHLKPDGAMQNQKQVKTDAALPAYCNPPNPCPLGYNAEDGCLEHFENTAAFSREYQSAQDCMCDSEHMFDCSNHDQQNSDLSDSELDQFEKYYNSRNVSARNFKDIMNDNLISESIYESSRLSFEIQQALDELEKFSLCLKPCYIEECSLNKEEETYGYCNLNSLLNIIKRAHIIKGLAEVIIPAKKVLKNSIKESVNSLFYAINNNETSSLSHQNDDEENTSTRLPQYNVPTTFKYGKELLNDTKGVIKEKIYITKRPKVDLNKTYWSELRERGNKEAKDKVPSKLLTESKLIQNKYISLLNEEFSIKEAKKDEEESNYAHELPFTAAFCLFVANVLFFIFTAIILWSWIQELTYFDDCDEILYYY